LPSISLVKKTIDGKEKEKNVANASMEGEGKRGARIPGNPKKRKEKIEASSPSRTGKSPKTWGLTTILYKKEGGCDAVEKRGKKRPRPGEKR